MDHVGEWIISGRLKVSQSEDSRRTKTASKFLKEVEPSQCGSVVEL